jgi:hypothetical protein
MVNITFSAYLTSWPNENAARNNLRVQQPAVHYRQDSTRAVLSSSRWGGTGLPHLGPETLDFTMQHYTERDHEHKSHGSSPLHSLLHHKLHALPHRPLTGQTQQVPPKHQRTCANYTESRAWRQLSQPTLPSLRTLGGGGGPSLADATLIIFHLPKFRNSIGTLRGLHRDRNGPVPAHYKDNTGTLQGQYLDIRALQGQ